jgi:hypothetical protein
MQFLAPNALAYVQNALAEDYDGSLGPAAPVSDFSYESPSP